MSLLTTFDAQTLRFAAVAREHVEKLGRRIRERREELKMSQDELGRRIGLKATGNYVSRWERGENAPGEDYLPLLAKALETTVADLWSGPEAERGGEVEETPDLMGSLNGHPAVDARLQQMDKRLAHIEASIQELVSWSQQGPTRKNLVERIETLTELIAPVIGAQESLPSQEPAESPPQAAPRNSGVASGR